MLWMQKFQIYYRSLNMLDLCRTRRHFTGEPFCVAQWSPFQSILSSVFKSLLTSLSISVFSHSQIFLPMVRNTRSGFHHQKSLCDLGVFEGPMGSLVLSCLQAPWASSKMKPWLLNVHIYECVEWPLTKWSHNWWWICHFPSLK